MWIFLKVLLKVCNVIAEYYIIFGDKSRPKRLAASSSPDLFKDLKAWQSGTLTWFDRRAWMTCLINNFAPDWSDSVRKPLHWSNPTSPLEENSGSTSLTRRQYCSNTCVLTGTSIASHVCANWTSTSGLRSDHTWQKKIMDIEYITFDSISSLCHDIRSWGCRFNHFLSDRSHYFDATSWCKMIYQQPVDWPKFASIETSVRVCKQQREICWRYLALLARYRLLGNHNLVLFCRNLQTHCENSSLALDKFVLLHIFAFLWFSAPSLIPEDCPENPWSEGLETMI